MAEIYEINGHRVEFANTPTEADLDEAAAQFGKSSTATQMEEAPSNDISPMQILASGPSTLGVPTGEKAGFYSSEVPSAAIRSSMMGTGYEEGAKNPSSVPKFADEFSKGKNESIGLAGAVSAPNKIVGGILDTATNPLDVLGMVVGATKPVAKLGEEILKGITSVKWGGIPKSLGPAKPSSANVQSTIDLLQSQAQEVDSVLTRGVRNIESRARVDASAVANDATIAKSNAKESELILQQQTEKKVGDLEVGKARVADTQARKIQQKYGMEANRKLNESFGTEYEKAIANETIAVDDATASLEKVLRNKGIIDQKGEMIREAIGAESDVLKLYQNLKARTPNDVIRLDVDKIPLKEWDRSLQNLFKVGKGKQYTPNQSILTDIRYETADALKATRFLRSKFRDDYQARNAVNDVFKVFSKRGEQGVNASALDVLTNPKSMQYGNNKRMMDFIAKYTKTDPSKPVVEMGNLIQQQKDALSAVQGRNRLASFMSERDVSARQAKILTEAEELKANLAQVAEGKKAQLAESAYRQEKLLAEKKIQEETLKNKKAIAKTVGWTAGGLLAGNKALGLAKKLTT